MTRMTRVKNRWRRDLRQVFGPMVSLHFILVILIGLHEGPSTFLHTSEKREVTESVMEDVDKCVSSRYFSLGRRGLAL
jgi:hypothetical protein